jgi:hypothetical protein
VIALARRGFATACSATLLAAVLTPSLAAAQASNNQISYGAITKAPVGCWAEYRMSKEGAEETRVRYTLVARDAQKIAIEVSSQTPLGPVTMRMEFSPDRNEATRWNLVAARLRMPDGELRQMPIPNQGDRARRREASFARGDSFGDRLGREQLTLPFGKLSAEHFRRTEDTGTTEVWMDDQVLPVGMVKLHDATGGRVELVATGTGGKSTL